MKKFTKFLIGTAAVGAAFTASTVVAGKIISKNLKVDPDSLYLTDEEVEKIERQARDCRSATDNLVQTKTETTCINFDGANFTDENGNIISDENVEKLFNESETTIVSISGISEDINVTENLISNAMLSCFTSESKDTPFNPVSFLRQAYTGAENADKS